MRTILLVDDEAIVRIGVKTCVNWEALGIERVFEASNGAEALEIIRTEQVDLVITDIKMSVMDGFAMLEELRTRKNAPKTIIMSCYNDYETMHQAILYGVKDFLFKPKMYPADIEQSIRKLFSKTDHSAPLTQELIDRLSPSNYLESFSSFVDLLRTHETDAGDIVKCVNQFTVRMMELDTPKQGSLHSFCSLLFQKLYELKKTDSREECLELLDSLIQSQETPSIREKLSKALAFIDRNLSNPNLSQEMVADHVSLSPSYFCRLFKNEMGLGYSSYIVKRRIELADRLLTSTDMKTGEIALAVGYTNEHYFSRLYKEYTGHAMKKFKSSLETPLS